MCVGPVGATRLIALVCTPDVESRMSMEVFLNLAWVCVAALMFCLWLRFASRRGRTGESIPGECSLSPWRCWFCSCFPSSPSPTTCRPPRIRPKPTPACAATTFVRRPALTSFPQLRASAACLRRAFLGGIPHADHGRLRTLGCSQSCLGPHPKPSPAGRLILRLPLYQFLASFHP